MAIVQVSRIQHRKGLQQDLPQLSSAEFGWALDTRKLYIGNGLISEGAASEGVTEILTQYSDLLNIAGAYTFRGAQSGYTSQTGISALQPVQRSLQLKVDDSVNIRDFGAVGDSVTNDTAALQRAIDQVYFGGFSLTQNRLRRVINIPAGIYVIDNSLKLNSHVILRGEGKDRTIIRQTNSSYPAVQLKDSNSQYDTLYGTGGAVTATNITIENLTLQHEQQHELVYLDTCSGIIFNRVNFVGATNAEEVRLAILAGDLSGQNGVRLVPRTITGATGIGPVLGDGIKDVLFFGCDFSGCTQGAVVNAVNVRFMACTFEEVGTGIYIGGPGASGLSSSPTNSVKITDSYFDMVYTSGIKVDIGDTGTPVNVTTSNNHFATVGYPPQSGGGLVTDPAYSPIDFGAENCISIGDTFDRPDSDAGAVPTVVFNSIAKNIALTANVGLRLGYVTHGTGTRISIPANSDGTEDANTQVSFSSTGSYKIDYSMSRGTARRNGQLKVSINTVSGLDIRYEDEYNEYPQPTNDDYYTYPGPSGVIFTVENDGNDNAVWFANTNATTGSATITYTVTSLR